MNGIIDELYFCPYAANPAFVIAAYRRYVQQAGPSWSLAVIVDPVEGQTYWEFDQGPTSEFHVGE